MSTYTNEGLSNKDCGICDSFYWLINLFPFTVSSQLGIKKQKSDLWDSPGPAVDNLPSKAGGMGLIPDPGILHMPWGN